MWLRRSQWPSHVCFTNGGRYTDTVNSVTDWLGRKPVNARLGAFT